MNSNLFGGWSDVGLTVSCKEDSPDSTPPARPLRSMQTGQNSSVPENSLPQLRQVRWGTRTATACAARVVDPRHSLDFPANGPHLPRAMNWFGTDVRRA